ncbi:hypothetical protein V6N13_125887 [Hibiscus sabdariffa]
MASRSAVLKTRTVFIRVCAITPKHVSNNLWKQPIEQEYPPVGNVSKQPPINFSFGGSLSSQLAYNDDGGYIPQFMYPQPSVYGEDMIVDSMTSLLSSMTISCSSFNSKEMFGSSSPSTQMMDDQWFNDEKTSNQPRRIVQSLRQYDETSSLH